MKHVLFICSKNRLRSPTAEQLFSEYPGIVCTSAGLNNDADNPVTPELIKWADLIFVMEKVHRQKLSVQFRSHLKNARVICVDIPDNYEFMDPALIHLLKEKITKFLPRFT